MLINPYFIYYFIVYLFLYLLMYSAVKKRFNFPFLLVSNLFFAFLIFHCLGDVLSTERLFYALSLIVGNTLVVYQNFKINDKLWSLVSLELQLGILLISIPNILISFLGIILLLFSFSRNFNRSKEFVLNSGLTILVLVFCLLTSEWVPDFSIKALSVKIEDYLVLISFLYFFLFYGLIRCLYETTSVESSSEKNDGKINYIIWLWIGMFNNFFILLFKDLDISISSTKLVSDTAYIIGVALLAILFLKIENVRSMSKHISYTIISQATVVSFLVIGHLENILSWLIFTNISLILFLVLFKEARPLGFLKKRIKLKFFTQLILILMFVGLPFTPWFNSKLLLLDNLNSNRSMVVYVGGFLFLGVRYRQNLILLINFIRQNHFKVSKAS